MTRAEMTGWDRLRHGGLLLDPQRLQEVAVHEPDALPSYREHELRRQTAAVVDGNGDVSAFVGYVLEKVCGLSFETGTWLRGSNVPAEWGRVAITGQTVKPRHLWRGREGGVLPVFLDREKRVGIGRGRRMTSQVLQWLRAGREQLALITNGRQWRLVFAGLDFDAWCEWDVDLWFEEGALSPQVSALRTLLSPALWGSSDEDRPCRLLQAVLDSRKGQAELSQVLGERVREAVELLVQGHGEPLKESCADVDPADIYRAAVRVVMRMVVVLFAESRDLLPRDHALYHGAYGLAGLHEELEKVAARGGNRLARSLSAWPRVLALFRLVHDGSHHPSLPVPAYGGELFAPGDPNSREGLSRVLAVFETACFEHEVLPDRDVHHVLERITRTRFKLRHGRASTWVPAPVDFSDLSSEYIGILYEGLLDFELKTAPPGDPIVFLAVGNQPALPLSRLDEMDDKSLKDLLEKLKDTSSSDEGDEEAEATEEPEETDEEAVEEDEEDEPDAAAEEGEDEEDTDERHTTRARAEIWARRAVDVGKLVRKPRGKLTPEKHLQYDEAIARKAHQLVTRVVLPGEWYLVRWGGTRKGSGTFYTRPGLAVPTVQRTLRPLAYDPPTGADGAPDRDAPPAAWTPKRPEEILALKVCDPACGSGSFPVAAMRFLTDALYASLHHHGRIAGDGDRSVVALLTGEESDEELLCQELLPCPPDDELFEPRLKAVLRRHVVERCIYGVDLDPLAVELCRLALWIETMDRTLPFSFINHKVKCGNSLVGAWFDQFQHYPAMAWKNREGGDKGHTNGVHFEKNVRTKAIKAFTKEHLQSNLADAIVGQLHLEKNALENPARVHDATFSVLSRLHDLPVQDSSERARIYREELLGSEAYRSLKHAMDLWCACWFWPADELEHAPLPTTFAETPESTRTVAARIAAEKRFFHWELEFPDVFRAAGSGFDAVLGNPPWETLQPTSKEFFSNIDPLYRSYGKQEALRYQSAYFTDENVERDWLSYTSRFANDSNWMKFAGSPFGDPDRTNKPAERFTIARGNAGKELHNRWRNARAKSRGFSLPDHPFRHRGEGKAYTYKLFLEQTHALLRDGGRMGFIVPSGLYSDHGTGALRELFLDHCRWEWLFGFENRDGIFDIHRSYKFNPVIIEKGGTTIAIRTAFMRRKLEDWERAESLVTPYDRAQVEQFSPKSKAILEIQSARDLEILEKIYANSVLLGDDSLDGWGIKYAQGEFNMTSDSKLFPPRPKWEEQGYCPDEYSRWLKGDWRPIDELWTYLGVEPLAEGKHRCAQPPYDRLSIPRADIPGGIIISRAADAWIREENIEDTALPFYQGLMIWGFDFSFNGWVSGRGRSAIWNEVPWDRKVIAPQYLLGEGGYVEKQKAAKEAKVCLRRITTAVHQRTAVVSLVPNLPCGDVASIVQPVELIDRLKLTAGLNLFPIDFVAKKACTYLHLDWHVVESLPVPRLPSKAVEIVLRLNCTHITFSELRIQIAAYGLPRSTQFALTRAERLRLDSMVQAIGLAILRMSKEDAEYLFVNCDLPSSDLHISKVSKLDPKGFWRVDKDKDPELRHTILTLIAFHDVQQKIEECGGDREMGIEAFCGQNDGEGWMLPETLCLGDYGLGHNERAKEHQPVASRLGPRFYDWQLEQDPEESWRECHLHARNLLGETGYRQLLDDTEAEKSGEERVPADRESVLALSELGLPLFDRG